MNRINKQGGNINIVSCIGSFKSSNLLLPHFLDHYRNQFSNCKFHIILHINPNYHEELRYLENNKKILDSKDCFINEIWRGNFSKEKVDKILNILKMDSLFESWCAVFDVDEFVFFPDNFQKQKIDAIKTVFVDMISTDQKEIKPDQYIFDQFPIPSQVTSKLLLGRTDKTVIFWNDGNLIEESDPIKKSNHCFKIPSKTLDCFYLMYHFKWDKTVKDRITKRLKTYKNYGHSFESFRFIMSKKDLLDFKINSVNELIINTESPLICDYQKAVYESLIGEPHEGQFPIGRLG